MEIANLVLTDIRVIADAVSAVSAVSAKNEVRKKEEIGSGNFVTKGWQCAK